MPGKRIHSILIWSVSITVVTLLLTGIGVASPEKILHNFIELGRGANPQASLVADAAGALYGTTLSGGTYGHGTVFRVTRGPDGKWTESVLHSFGATPDDGLQPRASLVIDAIGNLYGTTYYGAGANPYGMVFELSPVTQGPWKESVLHGFTWSNGDGAFPAGGLVFDGLGNLYGTTLAGGNPADDAGTVFELTPVPGGGWMENILYAFTGGADGSGPSARLIFDKQGNLYGTAPYGGDLTCNYDNDTAFGCGTVFKSTHHANGSWFLTVLLTFHGNQYVWSGPVGGVVSDSAGNLYGMNGDDSGGVFGSAFELVLESGGRFKEKILHNFSQSDGYPVGDLTLDAGGNLYGATYGVAFRLTPRSVGRWRETVLHQFGGGNDGAYPAAGVIADTTGNLYGTASEGGGARNLGVVFELTPEPKKSWKETVLYKFPPTDGSILDGALISDSEGNFYGMTNQGGAYECYAGGCGTVFKLSRSADGKWERNVLYNFKGGSDGSNPMGSLTFDQTGNLYGTTELGGNTPCDFAGPLGCGTVFELSPAQGGGWKEKVLYRFQGPPDGQYPRSSLVFDESGNLFGTAAFGGPCGLGDYGCGVVFEVSPSSNGLWKEKIIYGFTGQSDGNNPYAGLVFDGSGHLYGTTFLGGDHLYDAGVVFELSPRSGGWRQTVVHTFLGTTDGANPWGGVIVDASGNLYGTTRNGGSVCNYGCGTVFELTHTANGPWKKTILYKFGVGKDGANPEANLIFDNAGNLYGTTTSGYNSYGTVFKLTPDSNGLWKERLLHNFAGPPRDGGAPTAGVVFGLDGNLYGTTSFGGPDGYYVGGTLYSIEP